MVYGSQAEHVVPGVAAAEDLPGLRHACGRKSGASGRRASCWRGRRSCNGCTLASHGARCRGSQPAAVRVGHFRGDGNHCGDAVVDHASLRTGPRSFRRMALAASQGTVIVFLVLRIQLNDSADREASVMPVGPYIGAQFVATIYALVAWRWPRSARFITAIGFIAAGCFNIWTALDSPSLYVSAFGPGALPVYRTFIYGLFARHAAWFVLAIASGQLAVGASIFGDLRWRKFGYIGAIVFCSQLHPWVWDQRLPPR